MMRWVARPVNKHDAAQVVDAAHTIPLSAISLAIPFEVSAIRKGDECSDYNRNDKNYDKVFHVLLRRWLWLGAVGELRMHPPRPNPQAAEHNGAGAMAADFVGREVAHCPLAFRLSFITSTASLIVCVSNRRLWIR